MNDRLITALGALAALLALWMLLAPSTPPSTVTRPTSAEIGDNGYAALARWLEDGGVAVKSLRMRLDALQAGELPIPASGNVLISTMPHRDRIRHDEIRALWSWLLAGNTLLVMAALDDTPAWAGNVDGRFFLADLKAVSGLQFGVSTEQRSRIDVGEFTETAPVYLEGLAAHPLMEGVGELAGVSDLPASLWVPELGEDDSQLTLVLATEAGTRLGAMWQVSYGEGTAIVSALGSALTNRVLGEADNGRFFANVIRRHLGPDGAVVFDDMHQGLSTLYDPEAFYSDPRLGATLLFVLGLWGLYLLGSSTRLVPFTPRQAPPSQADFVTAVGGFMARKLSRAEAGRLMLDGWFEEMRRQGAVPARQSPWEALQALPALSRDGLARLRVHHDSLGRGESVDLRDLHNTIEELRRMLR